MKIAKISTCTSGGSANTPPVSRWSGNEGSGGGDDTNTPVRSQWPKMKVDEQQLDDFAY